MTKQLLIIKADTNDADYVHRVQQIDAKFDMDMLKRVAKAIKSFDADPTMGSYNWPKGECCDRDPSPEDIYSGVLTKEEIEWFDSLAPYGEHGIHTIESIEIYEFTSKKSLL